MFHKEVIHFVNYVYFWRNECVVNNVMIFQVEVDLGFLEMVWTLKVHKQGWKWSENWLSFTEIWSWSVYQCWYQWYALLSPLLWCHWLESTHHTQLSIIIKVTNTRFQKYTLTLPTLEILMMFMIRFLENNQTMQQYQLIPSETLINIRRP